MKKILIIILGLFVLNGFSQNVNCDFSDGNFYFQVLLNISTIPAVDFDKSDFILHLENNSNISQADSQFLNTHILEVYRQYPDSNEDPAQKYVYVVSDDHTIHPLLISYTESIDNYPYIFCDCAFTDGYFYYYVTLNTDVIPQDDFNKTSFINHMVSTSNLTTVELDFLNNSIVEAQNAFIGFQTESLQKTVNIISNYDLMTPYLSDFVQSIDHVEIICGQPVLSIYDITIPNTAISIAPIPIVNRSKITIDSKVLVDELLIYDVTGKLINKQKIKGLNTIPINEFTLKTGLYFFKFVTGNNYITKKVIVE